MSYCQSVAERHDGTLVIDKSHIDGTTIVFELPIGLVEVEVVAGEHQASPADSLGGSLRVLVIDDEESLRHAITKGLTRAGYRCSSVGTGRGGVERFVSGGVAASTVPSVAVDLRKGAGPPTDEAANEYVRLHGFDALDRVAKLHLKNTEKIRA